MNSVLLILVVFLLCSCQKEKQIKENNCESLPQKEYTDPATGIVYHDLTKDKRLILEKIIVSEYISNKEECLHLLKKQLPYKDYNVFRMSVTSYIPIDIKLKGGSHYCMASIERDSIGFALNFSYLQNWPSEKMKEYLSREAITTDSLLEAGEAISSRRYEKYSREEFDSVWVHYFHQYKDSLIYLENF